MHLSAVRPMTGHRRPVLRCTRQHAVTRRNLAVTAAAKQAVVIGSGMSGLSTAQVLSKHFDNVLVLERDQPQPVWDSDAIDIINAKGSRRGVTQYNHLHGLTAGGLKALDDIFGGQYKTELQAAGGVVVDVIQDTRVCLPSHGTLLSGYKPKQEVLGAFCTRHLFEITARKLVAQNPKVSFKYGAKADGLILDRSSNSSSNGVKLADGTVVHGDLIVDCGGRNSPMPKWLEVNGWGSVRVSEVTAHCGYASFLVQLTPEAEQELDAHNIKSIYCRAEAPEPTLGILMHAENDMWIVGMGGYNKLYPPMQDDQLMEYVENVVWHPEIARLIKGAKFLAPAGRFFGVGSTWRHYEEMTLPENVIIMADSICSFSPVHGQGMTVAATEARALDQLLTQRGSSSSSSNGAGLDLQGLSNQWQQTALPIVQYYCLAAVEATAKKQLLTQHGSSSTSSNGAGLDLQGLSNQWQQTAEPIVQAAWDLATGTDMRFEGASSTDPPKQTGLIAQLLSKYNAALVETANNDYVVNETVVRVFQCLDNPAKMVAPEILGRVLLFQLKKAFKSVSFGANQEAVSNNVTSNNATSDNSISSSSGDSARAKAFMDPAKYELLAPRLRNGQQLVAKQGQRRQQQQPEYVAAAAAVESKR